MEDLRIRRTKKLIQDATMQLIDEKGFANVRIVDIASRAGVNRNTIYLHYETKEDIIISMVDEAFANSGAVLNFNEILKSEKRITRKKLTNIFEMLFKTIDENIELYRIVLTDPNLSGYLDKRILKIRTVVLNTVKPTKRNNIGIEYLVSGIYGVVQKWIIYGTGTIEDNVKILTEFTFINYSYLLITR